MLLTLLANVKRDVQLEWLEEVEDLLYPVHFDNGVKPLNFNIRFLNANHSELTYRDEMTRQFLHANFVFERRLIASIVNDYIPSFLVVCLSMVSFWLDIHAVPGRVTLGVTAVLTLSTQILHIRNSLPTVDYLTAMDIWLLGCMLMVFLSLIEFTLAQSLARGVAGIYAQPPVSDAFTTVKEDSSQQITATAATGKQDFITKIPSMKPKWQSFFSKKNPRKDEPLPVEPKDNKLDRISRVAFPIIMIIFSLIYWIYFFNEAYGKK